MTFVLAALIGLGSPGSAEEYHRAFNVSVAVSVPQGDASVSAQTIPVFQPAVATIQSLPTGKPSSYVEPTRSGDVVAYGSLAAAVAGQRMSDAMGDDVTCLAGAIYFEAKGEPLSGQLAVGAVIRNRARSGRFPGTICSVVTQPGQFSFVRGGRVPAIADNAAYRTAVAVARVALADAWDSEAADAMYFHARRVAPGWHRTQVAAIGNHVFYR